MAGCTGCERQRKAGFGPGHCGIDLLGLNRESSLTRVSLSRSELNPQPLTTPVPGDELEVEIPAPNRAWLGLAMAVYGIPTIALLLGASAGSAAGEWQAALGGLIGLCAGLWFGRRSVHVPPSMASLTGPGNPVMRIVSVDTHVRS